MIVIDNVLISDDVIEKKFVCDLSRCKGACCEDGDAGAPLEESEKAIIDRVYETIRPYLTIAAQKEIEKKGKYVWHDEFGWVTPTLESDKEICVYGMREKDGTIHCAFERAYLEKKIDWKKPISCHLYPIITEPSKYQHVEHVNYDARPVACAPACQLGKKLKVPVYEFLKEPIVRKWGLGFWKALDAIAKGTWKENQKRDSQ
jgi:Fe-S-cluster containining protein